MHFLSCHPIVHTIKFMEITFDSAKNERNIRERGLSFELVRNLDWNATLIVEDMRTTYPERRFEAIAPIGDRLHIVIFTPTDDGVRVISFRKANLREVRRYAKAQP
jgi:uncharacterized protein